jgi:hypothetical protein
MIIKFALREYGENESKRTLPFNAYSAVSWIA